MNAEEKRKQMISKRHILLKNVLLLSTYVIGILPSFVFDTDLGTSEVWLSLTHARGEKTYFDYALLYYSWSINFLILAYMLHYPKHIDRRVSRFILIICALDLLHLIIAAKQGFVIEKVGLALGIVMAPQIKTWLQKWLR
jgi:hypothetical protein